jgi:radical SAM superfamily enzyme YgiQ (UPF0313 family)
MLLVIVERDTLQNEKIMIQKRQIYFWKTIIAEFKKRIKGYYSRLEKIMRVLLINPLTDEEKINVCLPNLGLGFLATSIRKEGFEVEIVDGCKKKMTSKLIKERLYKVDYDIVGFQVFTMVLNKTKEYLNFVKSINPKIITIVGGPHPSVDRENIMKYLSNCDFAIVGEGEESLPKLLNLLNESKNKNNFYNIPNLIWRRDSEIIINKIEYIENLDIVGIPSWDLINPYEYPHAPMGTFIKSFPFAPINITRGCPFSCTFCTANLVMGKKIRSRNLNYVIEEIKILVDKYKIKELLIIDDNFTLNKKIAKEFCKKIIEENFKINISFPNGLKLSTLDEELLYLLEEAGCYSIALGIE